MTDYAIEVKGLTKEFDGKIAVNHISLTVEKGSIFGFLGSNGSGKTTTIRMICGLLTPTEGEGTCLGYDMKTQTKEIKEKVGYMPQKFSFYTGLTVYENLRFVSDIFQVNQTAQKIKDMMADLELGKYKDVQAGNLSGGWKQRLSLACSLIHQPQLLFLDEPTAGVDPKARKEFWDYLHRISTEKKTTILVTTHYMDEAEKCNNLAYINLGKLLYQGSTEDLIPKSGVKAYVVALDKSLQRSFIEKTNQQYPELDTSIIKNELRVSSQKLGLLNALMQENKDLPFQEVTPSFEEVFIGLIP